MFDDPPWELRRRAADESCDTPLDDLAYIRRTMSDAGSFTAIPGRGMMAMGMIGMGASYFGSLQGTPLAWLVIWIAAAAAATTVGLVTMHRKASHARVPMWSGPGARFVLGLCPPLAVGAIMTAVFFLQDLFILIPGTWLLLYGAGVLTAGNASVRIIPVIGISFMALGTFALLWPTPLAYWFLALGFGLAHVIFGAFIAWRYGG